MKVTLFTPSAHQTYANIKRSSKRQPTLGPSYLLASLAADDHRVSYIDGDALDLIRENAAAQILKTDPAMVGISLTTGLFSETRDVAKALRRAGWKGHLALGGVHPSSLPEETLELIPEADSVLVGEAENSIVKLARCLEKKEEFGSVDALAYREKNSAVGKIVLHRSFELIEELDRAPLPALEYYPMDRYVSPMWTDQEYKKMGVLITSRGCPFQCEFCASGARSRTRYRRHSVSRVMTEIERLVREFRVDYLVFNDDTFTADKQRCLEICSRMKQRGLALPFMVTSRVNTVDLELLQALKDTGCFLITYGIESGSQEILKSAGKDITLEDARAAVRDAKKAGLKTVGNYMFGHWSDTSETCRATLDFALELACDISQFAITIPYPGSVLHQKALAAKRLHPTADYRDYGYYGNMPWDHPNLSERELIDVQKEAYARCGHS